MSKVDPLTYSSQPKLTTEIIASLDTKDDLSNAYSPGIAEVAKLIQDDQSAMFTHTFRRNNLAVISEGSAVLGLGNIGHKASYPIMEGKAMLFKRFGHIDAIPLIVSSQDVDIFVDTVVQIADSFAAINIEDIAAPNCFEIEKRLKEKLDIPIMHDDQHGTAVVVLAALMNAMQFCGGKDKASAKVVISGAGAAGIGILNILHHHGFTNITLVDSKGIISKDRTDLVSYKQDALTLTNPHSTTGTLETALKDVNIFIGVSKGGLLTSEMIQIMAPSPIIIAMANPIPEINPDVGMQAGACLVATGRSDYPNQVNNALAFPGIFRGAIDARTPITEKMKLAAANAIVEYHRPNLEPDQLLPSILDPDVHQHIAKAVKDAA